MQLQLSYLMKSPMNVAGMNPFPGRRTNSQRSLIVFAMTFEQAESRIWGLTSFEF